MSDYAVTKGTVKSNLPGQKRWEWARFPVRLGTHDKAAISGARSNAVVLCRTPLFVADEEAQQTCASGAAISMGISAHQHQATEENNKWSDNEYRPVFFLHLGDGQQTPGGKPSELMRAVASAITACGSGLHNPLDNKIEPNMMVTKEVQRLFNEQRGNEVLEKYDTAINNAVTMAHGMQATIKTTVPQTIILFWAPHGRKATMEVIVKL
jgi:hypothetical protein